VPDKLRQSGALEGMDPDDRMHYSFDIAIRRSVMRSQIEDPRNPGIKQPLEDLYDVHVRVYKAFSFREENNNVDVRNDPLYEWDFYVSAAR